MKFLLEIEKQFRLQRHQNALLTSYHLVLDNANFRTKITAIRKQ